MFCFVQLQLIRFLAGCVDLGGPRKEFFVYFLKEISAMLVKQDRLINTKEIVELYCGRRLYYYFGLVIGEWLQYKNVLIEVK